MRTLFLMFLVSLTTPVLAVVSTTAQQNADLVLVLHAPWQSGPNIVDAAGGRAIGPLGSPLSILAASEAPDFVARIHRQGGWALDGNIIAALCGVKI